MMKKVGFESKEFQIICKSLGKSNFRLFIILIVSLMFCFNLTGQKQYQPTDNGYLQQYQPFAPNTSEPFLTNQPSYLLFGEGQSTPILYAPPPGGGNPLGVPVKGKEVLCFFIFTAVYIIIRYYNIRDIRKKY